MNKRAEHVHFTERYEVVCARGIQDVALVGGFAEILKKYERFVLAKTPGGLLYRALRGGIWWAGCDYGLLFYGVRPVMVLATILAMLS
ncbi:hypothetical protein N7453_009518 [Penicillium expansum]|nr:hypothetical protein N7453_009518 [Penicillium expansum]